MRTSSCLVLVACCLAVAASARAAPLSDDEPLIGPRLEQRDVLPHELWADHQRASLWIAIDGQLRRSSEQTTWGAFVLLSVPLDRLSKRAGAFAQDTSPALKPPPRAPKGGPPAEPPAPKLEPSAAVDTSPPVPIVLTPAVARRAVKAALRAARLDAPDVALDRLAARARSSALMPELRLRAMRVVDEAQNLAPTEYDPARTTASGGTTLWLEARATWRLDRLVFADDEVAIERLRDERAEQQRKVAARVLEALFEWQRAVALEANPHASADEHAQAALRVIEAEALLDVLTDGWFTRWRGGS